MRIYKLYTICTIALSAILFLSLEASAQFDSDAGAGCIDETCMFGGRTFGRNDGVAQLHKINIFSVDGKDPREAQDRAAAAVRALAPIGVVTNNNPVPQKDGHSAKGQATSFMVSPCLALTNHHVAFGSNSNPDISRDFSMTMEVGIGINGGFAYKLNANPVRSGEISAKKASDWVLVQVEKCPGRKTGWMNVATIDMVKAVGLKVSMAGYPVDRSQAQLTLQKSCRLWATDGSTGNFEHDCGSRSGSSGSPLFAMVDGRPTVVAMNVGADTNKAGVLKYYDSIDANQAVPFNFLKDRPEIMKLINDDINRWGQENSAFSAPAVRQPSST